MRDNKISKKIAGLLIVLLLGVYLCTGITAQADAGELVKNGFKKTIALSNVDKKAGYWFVVDGPGKITKANVKIKVKSSKKSVASVKSEGYGIFAVYPKKPGRTTVTITGVSNGKKFKYKGTIKVVKFQRPFKTFKMDGKSYLKEMKSTYNILEMSTDKSAVKFNYKLKSGWKINKVYVNGKKVKFKNGKKIALGNDGAVYITMQVKNKKTGATMETYIDISNSSIN